MKSIGLPTSGYFAEAVTNAGGLPGRLQLRGSDGFSPSSRAFSVVLKNQFLSGLVSRYGKDV
jgi:hypothetical protein